MRRWRWEKEGSTISEPEAERPVLEWRWEREAELDAIGAELARLLAPPPSILLLSGPLGSGKTALAGRIIARLGVAERVTSPTYDLVRRYALGDVTVLHADLYRVQDPAELTALDLPSPGQADTIGIIEWGEDLRVLYPDHFWGELAEGEAGTRRLRLTASGPVAGARLAAWGRSE